MIDVKYITILTFIEFHFLLRIFQTVKILKIFGKIAKITVFLRYSSQKTRKITINFTFLYQPK